MKEAGIPAFSAAVLRGGEIVYAEAWGVREVGKDEPATPETLFQAGSISKPVACLAALRLVEQGVLDLDRDVNEYLRSWQVPAVERWLPKITLRRLMSHTAGMTVHGFPGYDRNENVPTVPDVLDGKGNTPRVRVDIVPGSQWRYSGGGTTIVHLVMTDVTGRSFPDLLRGLVLEPAGMTRSTFEQPLPETRWSEAAIAVRDGIDKPVPGGWHVYPEMAAAGLWTTPTDLLKFAIAYQRALAGEQGALISRELARIACTAVAPGTAYGLGPQLEGARFGHGGGNDGYLSNLTAGREGGYGCAVQGSSLTCGPLLLEITNAVALAENWPDYEAPKGGVGVKLDELIPRFTGTYKTEAGMELMIAFDAELHGLTLATSDQAPIMLNLVGLSEATVEGLRTTVEFHFEGEPGAAPTTGITLRQPGSKLLAKRV